MFPVLLFVDFRDLPDLVLGFTWHICATPHFATYSAMQCDTPPKSETTKDPEIEGSRSQHRSVTDHPPLSDCTEAQQNKCFGSFRAPEERSYRTLITS